jgi:Flp pilus assembly secretin CpaC
MSFLNHRYAAALAAAALTASCTATAYAYVQPIYLEINQSYYLPQTSVIKRVAVSNPAIADVVVVSKREINIIAKQNGTTSLTIWTTNGMRQEFTVNVNPSDTGTALAIQKAIGLPHVRVQKVGDKILLRGTVRNQYEKTLAFRVASMYTKPAEEKMNQRNIKMGNGQTADGGVGTDISTEEGTDSSENVINLLEMVNPDQINIEALVLEIRASDAEQLGERYASPDPSQTSGAGVSTSETRTNSNTGSSQRSQSGGASWSGTATQGYTGSNTQTSNTSNAYQNENGTKTNTYQDASGTASSQQWNQSVNRTGSVNRSMNGSDEQTGGNSYESTYSRTTGTNNIQLGSIGQFFFGETYGPQRSKGSHWYTRNWLFTHFSQINVQLQMLITKGRARVISRPNITTMSGKTAGIFIGGEVPYPRRENNSTTTDYKKYGVQLDLRKPVVDTSGNITAELDATVSRLDWENAVTADGFRAPALKTRQATTTVNIPSGMTMAIGGLLNSEDSKTLSKVPLLGDIPILGELFKYHNNSHEDTELLILITPRVVNEETPASMSPSMEDWYAENRQADKRRAAVDLNSAAPPKTRAQKKAEERAKAAAAEKNQDKHAAKLSEQEDSLLGKYLNQKVLAGATPEEKEAAEKN